MLSPLYCKQGRGDGSRIKMVRYTSPVISTSTIFFFWLKRKSYKNLGTYKQQSAADIIKMFTKDVNCQAIGRQQAILQEVYSAVCATVDIYWSVYKDRQITSRRADFTQDCLCLSNVYFKSLEWVQIIAARSDNTNRKIQKKGQMKLSWGQTNVKINI